MTAPPRSRRWVWFFVVVTLLAIAGVTIPIVYNLRQQLTREELDGAVQRWEEHGPRSYNLRYVVRQPNSEPETYQAQVRNGRVVAAHRNGRPLEPRQWTYHDMRGRFSDIRQFLEKDREPGRPRAFVTAQFDRKDGRLIRYVRSVSGTRERVEIDVQELTPVAEDTPRPNDGGR